MSPEGRQKLKNLLILHESYKQFPYSDVTGHITIGIGRNLNDRGISTSEALTLLDDDLFYFTSKLTHYISYFTDLDENRQIALIDMCFNIGINGLLEFHDMLNALEKRDFNAASKAMLDSKWAEQVGERAEQLSSIIKTGDL